jgi:hypothetical protein
MDAAFEAVVWNDVDISLRAGNLLLPRGLYMVTMLHDERGGKDGAQLARIDIKGEPPIRLTEDQFETP